MLSRAPSHASRTGYVLVAARAERPIVQQDAQDLLQLLAASDVALPRVAAAVGLVTDAGTLRLPRARELFGDMHVVAVAQAPYRCSCLSFALHAHCEHAVFAEGLGVGPGVVRNFAWRVLLPFIFGLPVCWVHLRACAFSASWCCLRASRTRLACSP